MASEWNRTTLGEFVRLQRGHDLTADQRVEGRYPVMGSAGQNGTHNEYKAKGPGVVIGRSGASIGRVHFTPIDYWPHNTCLYVTDFLGNNARFVYYLLGSVDLAAFNSGSAQPSLNRNYIYNLPLTVPGVAEQQRVSEFVAMLDERIDNLRQTNATLEAIAQALFKSWFVDFDPVHAKAEGREPEGMDPATAALFPDRLEKSELGEIPSGWRVATLQEHAMVERGLSYKGSGLAEDGVPMHNLNSVLEGGGYKYMGIKYYRGEYKDRHVACPGDLIVANTEQGHHHRLIGFPAVVPQSFETGIYSHHLYRLRINEQSPLTPEWIYRCLMVPAVREQIIGCANGSTVNMLKSVGLQIPKFVEPAGLLCIAFDGIAKPIRQKMESNVIRIGSLSELRDTLLPRLISGKLRLPEAEREIEAATA